MLSFVLSLQPKICHYLTQYTSVFAFLSLLGISGRCHSYRPLIYSATDSLLHDIGIPLWTIGSSQHHAESFCSRGNAALSLCKSFQSIHERPEVSNQSTANFSMLLILSALLFVQLRLPESAVQGSTTYCFNRLFNCLSKYVSNLGYFPSMESFKSSALHSKYMVQLASVMPSSPKILCMTLSRKILSCPFLH